MSVPIKCSTCNAVVGVLHGLVNLNSTKSFASCPGEGKHPEPVRVETLVLGGQAVRVDTSYPETSTKSSWHEYRGEMSRDAMKAAMLGLKIERMLIEGTWAYIEKGRFYYGGPVLEEARA